MCISNSLICVIAGHPPLPMALSRQDIASVWDKTNPSLLSRLANIASRGTLSAVGRTVRSDLSLLLYLTGYTGYSLWLQKKRYINIARKHRNKPNNRKKVVVTVLQWLQGVFPKSIEFFWSSAVGYRNHVTKNIHHIYR